MVTPTRRTRPTYVPPHLRDSVMSSTYTTEFTHPGPHFTTPRNGEPSSRLRGGCRGRGHDRSQWWPATRENANPKASRNRSAFDITEKFDELDITDEDNSNDDSVINFDAYEDIPVEATGSNIPAPVNSFSDIDLGEGLTENIKRCKYVKPTPIQKHAIPIVVSGRDLMACAQTGSGKTAAFCFPIISGILRKPLKTSGSGRGWHSLAYPTALILSPTRELSCQIRDEAKKFAHNTGVKIVVAYGGSPIVHQFRNLEKGVDILVATPGRLVDMIERSRVSLRMIKYLALDEADRMLDMGFEPQIRKIVQQMDMPPPGERQTMLFSATFPHEIQRLASDFLSDYIFLTVGRVGSSTDLIAQRVELVQDMNKRNHLMDLLHDQKANGTHGKCSLTLVFVETKRGADALEYFLSMNGFSAIAIHGDKIQRERERAIKSFKSGATPILVATDVASRGLDIPHVSHVINYDLPKVIDDYVHRIGRTGRAGKSGMATAFFSDKNIPLSKALVELMMEAKQEVPSWLSEYAENSSYGGGGRGKRYGNSKFGGNDFRKDAKSGTEYYCHSSHYGGSHYVVDSYASRNAFDYAVSSSADHYPCATADSSHGYMFDHESIVASGWD